MTNFSINYDSTEIRFYLIGPSDVGKKSLARRFYKLNASKTIIGREIEFNLDDRFLKKLQNKDENKNKTLFDIKQNEIAKIENFECVNFYKIYTSKSNSLEFRFFIPSLPTSINYSDGKSAIEELNEFEKKHNLKFDSFNQEMDNYIKSPNYNYFKTNYTETYHVLLFIYDITNIDTLIECNLYFEQLNKIYNLVDYDIEKDILERNVINFKIKNYNFECITKNKDFQCIFLGNKVDILGTVLNDNKEFCKIKNKTINSIFHNIYANAFKNKKNLIQINESLNNSNHNINIKKKDSVCSVEVNSTDNFFKINKSDLSLIDFSKDIQYKKKKIIPFYELSTKQSFNFEIFIVKLFVDTIIPGCIGIDNNNANRFLLFLEKEFKDSILNIMYSKTSFAKSERNTLDNLINNHGSNVLYSTDIYSFENEDVKKKAFTGKHKGKTKIFVNKTGPLFKPYNKDKSLDFKRKDLLSYKEIRGEVYNKQEIEDKIKRDKLLYELNKEKVGYSLGLAPSKNNYKLKRIKNKINKSNILKNILSLDNITKSKDKSRHIRTTTPKINKYKSPSRKQFENNIKIINKKNKEKGELLNKNIEDRLNKIQKLKEDCLLENQKQIAVSISKRNDLKKLVVNNKLKFENQIKSNLINNEYFIPVGSSIDTNKGFSIVGKPKIIEINPNWCDEFYSLKSEFDYVVEKYKDNNNFSTYIIHYILFILLILKLLLRLLYLQFIRFSKADRFNNNTIKHFDENLKKWIISDEAALNKIKSKKIKELEEKAKIRLDKKKAYIQEEAELRANNKERLKYLKESSKYNNNTEENDKNTNNNKDANICLLKDNNKSPSVWSYEPDYYKWGESYPMYSIGAKLPNYFLTGKKNNSSRLLGFDQSIKLLVNSLSKNDNSNPKYEYVEESSPKFSFSKASNRFKYTNVSNNTNNNCYYKHEYVSFNKDKNKVMYFSKAKRKDISIEDKAYIPGPGQYTIKSQLDIASDKERMIIKTKLLEKKKKYKVTCDKT